LKKGTNYDHLNSNKEDINHLNRSITENETEAAIKHSKKQKTLALDGLSAEFYQTFQEELILTLLKLFCEVERKEHCLTHFMKPELQSSPKPDKHTSKKKIIDQSP
jgi:hypothetical protein